MKVSYIGKSVNTKDKRNISLYNIYNREVIPWLFLIPCFITFAFFVWEPFVKGVYYSLHKVTFKTFQFVSFDNYLKLFTDNLFWTAWKNTFYYSFLTIIIGFLTPVIIGIFLCELRRLKGFFRTAFYIPAVIPGAIVAMMWMWFYDPSPSGLLNVIIGNLGLEPFDWLLNKDFSMVGLVIIATWAGAGSTSIIYLAALEGIPGDYYEAGEVDGMNIWNKIINITIPQIKPIMLIMLILQIIGTMQVFNEPFIMTGGGPANATMTVMLQNYYIAFRYYDSGTAAAYGVIIFFVLFILSLIYFRGKKLSDKN